MKSVCNIVRFKKTKLDFKLPFNDVGSIEDIDPMLPTLVVGYDIAKLVIKGFNPSIFDYPEQNIYWALAENESYMHFEEQLKQFSDRVIMSIIGQYSYVNIDVITLDEIRLAKIKTYCCSSDDRLIYFMGNQVFFLSQKFKVVWGVSLEKLSYMGWKLNDVLPFDHNDPHNRFIDKLSMVPSKLRKRLNDNVWKIMVLVMYLDYKN